MAHVINQDKCAGCGSCAEACPTECIVEKDGKYVVTTDDCVDCGACEGACPCEAIEAE